jgi:hypothetical protein
MKAICVFMLFSTKRHAPIENVFSPEMRLRPRAFSHYFAPLVSSVNIWLFFRFATQSNSMNSRLTQSTNSTPRKARCVKNAPNRSNSASWSSQVLYHSLEALFGLAWSRSDFVESKLAKIHSVLATNKTPKNGVFITDRFT